MSENAPLSCPELHVVERRLRVNHDKVGSNRLLRYPVATQFLGLLCLLLGMAAFFGLWLLTIKNRSKTIEADAPVSTAPKVPSGPLREGVYSLSPSKEQSIVQSAKSRGAGTAPADLGIQQPLNVDQESLEDGEVAATDDPMAKTHLEIANQFFSMGDFEGATEMCQLVLDNEDASPAQKSCAEQLMMECA